MCIFSGIVKPPSKLPALIKALSPINTKEFGNIRLPEKPQLLNVLVPIYSNVSGKLRVPQSEEHEKKVQSPIMVTIGARVRLEIFVL